MSIDNPMDGREQLAKIEPNLEKLEFAELKRTYEKARKLAEITFHETEEGFFNALGDGISIREGRSGYNITSVSRTLEDVHRLLALRSKEQELHYPTSAKDKETLIAAIKKMLEDLGKRIIE